MDSNTPQTPPEPAPPVQFEYSMDPRDYLRANMFMARPRLWRSAFVLVGLAIVSVLVATAEADPPRGMFWFGAGIFLAVAALMPLITRTQLRDSWRLQPALEQVQKVSLTPEGMLTEDASGHRFIRWHVFSHFRELPDMFLLYLSPRYAVVVPRRAMTAAQWDQSRALLKEVIGRTKRQGSTRGFPVAPPAELKQST